MTLIRRQVLFGGTAVLALAHAARAEDAPAPAQPAAPQAAPPQAAPPQAAPPQPGPSVPSIATTPPVPPAGTPTPPRPPAASPAPPAPAASIDRTKAYYVYFDQSIDLASMRALRRQCTALAEAGVGHITIVLHSSGGLVDATLTTYGFLRALPCTIDMHALGFVASAANLLLLAGERRTANRNCRFLFHPTTVPFATTMNSGQMHDRLTQFDAVAASIQDIYRERTRFTDEELATFNREEVIYTPGQALKGGLIHEVADLHIPGPSQARVVFLD